MRVHMKFTKKSQSNVKTIKNTITSQTQFVKPNFRNPKLKTKTNLT